MKTDAQLCRERERIHRLRGKYKHLRPLGGKSFAERMAEFTREEIALEAAKFARFWGGTGGRNPG